MRTPSERFKENVKSIENAFEIVSQLQSVTYDWIETVKSDIGFIAEEVEKKEEGIVEGMNYSKLTVMLIEVGESQ